MQGVQLFIKVIDIDLETENELVDTFLIDITVTDALVGSGISPTIYNGSSGIATIELSFHVMCAENYYGADCSCTESLCTVSGNSTDSDDLSCVGTNCNGNSSGNGSHGVEAGTDSDVFSCVGANCNKNGQYL